MRTSDVVQATIAEWQKRLLQLDRRNNLLYFKQGSRSAVRIQEDIDEFLVALSESRTGLTFDYAERRARRRADPFDLAASSDEEEQADEPYVVEGAIETDHKPLELQPRLKNLRRKDREWREEQGVNVLFLAVGFVSWVDEDSVEGKAPLLLVPCDLEVPSPRDPFSLLRETDDVEVNATLAYKLSMLGVQLPEFDNDRAPSHYLAEVARLIRAKPGWSVAPEIILSTFQYSKMAMWKDLEQLRNEGVEQDLVRALAGDPDVADPPPPPADAVFNQPIATFAGGRLDDALDARDQLLILRADYSQLLSVAAARSGDHLIIHGPPGTGKSQTIANIIGSFIADGKSVLFVSEKTAALDVVKRRLEECSLGVFCLDLHSERGKKANAYEQLRASLEDSRVISLRELDYDALTEARSQLNRYVRALHERRLPLGDTVYRMHGRLSRLRNAPDVSFKVERAREIDEPSMREILRLSERIAQRREEFAQHSTSIWVSLRDSSNPIRLADELREAARAALEQAESTKTTAGRLEDRIGGPEIQSCEELAKRARVLPLLAGAPGVPSHWLDIGAVHNLRDVATRERAVQEDWQRCQRESEPHFEERPSLRFSEVAEKFDSALNDEDKLTELLGHEWSTRFAAQGEALVSAAEELPRLVQDVAARAEDLAVALGAKVPGRRSDLRRLAGQAAAIRELAPVPDCWVAPTLLTRLIENWNQAVGRDEGSLESANARAAIVQIEQRVAESAEILRRMTEAETSLLRDYDEQLVVGVDQDLLVRYRTDHRNFFKRLGGQFRKDQRLLNGARKSSAKLTLTEATAAVELALEVKRLREDWRARASLLPQWLGPRFKGRESDWERIAGDLTRVSNLFATLSLNDALAACLTQDEARDALDATRHSAEQALAAMEAVEAVIYGEDREPAGTETLDSTNDPTSDALPALRGLNEVFAKLRRHLRHEVQDAQEVAAILAIAVRLEELEEEVASRSATLGENFGEPYKGLDTDWAGILDALTWVEEFLKATSVPMSEKLRDHAVRPQPTEAYEVWEREALKASEEYDIAVAAIDAKFDVKQMGWRDWRRAPFDAFTEWLDNVARQADQAADFLQYRRLAGDLETKIGAGVVSMIRAVTDDATQITPIVERRYASAWLESVYAEEQCLREFAERDHRGVIEEFKRLDESAPMAAQKKIRERVFAGYPGHFAIQAGSGQLATLEAQLSRRRGQLPVRKLVERIPTLLQTLKPCFMMSPLAVSQFLPKGDSANTLRFDTVIFDEASQVFPEDAVPAIERASQVVVVGDEKQLPPTSFFRRDLDGADEYGSSDDDDDTDDPDALSGRESILDAMDGMRAKGVSESYLRVHYRSRHEDLIRFSNHHFYGGRLLVFPSPFSQDDGIGLNPLFLEDGRYDAGEGRTRTNRREAEEVVRLVFEHMRSRPSDESIGVVTLSRAQADLIELLVAERRVLERDIDDRFNEDINEPFFVKNLENVQGDERDHIILSVGYGRTASGSVSNNFGPLNKEGGERRLNVAISRSRESMTTVYSMRPTDITSTQPGAQLLRRWLEFNENPATYFTAQQSIDPLAEPESPFEESVIAALRSRGHIVQPQVGVAGFRIDMAIMSPDGKTCDLGIECDGWTYHGSPAARDRDWLRQSILEGLGWRIHRIWSTAWIRNPDEQIKAIEDALELARTPTVAGASPVNPSAAASSEIAKEAAVAAPARPKDRWIFEPYEVASLLGLRHSSELQYAPRAELEPMLIRIAEAEGPAHIDVAIERIREHYGMARARQASRDHVRHVLEELGRKKQLMIWREGTTSKRATRSVNELFFDVLEPVIDARRPFDASASRRTITQISFAEIEVGLMLVARALFGASREDLLRETARQFWYDRTGPDINSRIGAAIDGLVEDGRLVESFGMLTAFTEPTE